MTFQRFQFSKDVQSHVYQKATRMAMCWHHFSTSVIDPFILPGLQGMLVTTSFVVSRSLFPVIANVWDVFMVTLIYLVMNIMLWLFCSVILGNILHNGSIPTSSNFYSTIVTQWITAIRLQKLLFLSPFRALGTKWHACLLRLEGARIGKGFFCLNEKPLIDAPFTSIGDDVIMDYGAEIRCHSFDDHQLKFSSVTIECSDFFCWTMVHLLVAKERCGMSGVSTRKASLHGKRLRAATCVLYLLVWHSSNNYLHGVFVYLCTQNLIVSNLYGLLYAM